MFIQALMEIMKTDPVSPFNNALDGISKYAWSKLGGECAVRLLDRYLIIRLYM